MPSVTDLYETDIVAWPRTRLVFSAGALPASWSTTKIARLPHRNPSLQDYPTMVLADAYADAREKAMAEIGLLDLPPECPWTIEQVLAREFWPDIEKAP